MLLALGDVPTKKPCGPVVARPGGSFFCFRSLISTSSSLFPVQKRKPRISGFRQYKSMYGRGRLASAVQSMPGTRLQQLVRVGSLGWVPGSLRPSNQRASLARRMRPGPHRRHFSIAHPNPQQATDPYEHLHIMGGNFMVDLDVDEFAGNTTNSQYPAIQTPNTIAGLDFNIPPPWPRPTREAGSSSQKSSSSSSSSSDSSDSGSASGSTSDAREIATFLRSLKAFMVIV